MRFHIKKLAMMSFVCNINGVIIGTIDHDGFHFNERGQKEENYFTEEERVWLHDQHEQVKKEGGVSFLM